MKCSEDTLQLAELLQSCSVRVNKNRFYTNLKKLECGEGK